MPRRAFAQPLSDCRIDVADRYGRHWCLVPLHADIEASASLNAPNTGQISHPRVGHRAEPMGELSVQVVEIAEQAGEEEVLADVAERPLDLTLGLGPVGAANL